MSNNGDDELERRLRDVLSSRGLGVPVPPDAIDRIHAGARRRQQRHSAASVIGAVAIIAIAAVGIGVRSSDHGSTNTAGNHTPGPGIPSASSAAPPSTTPLIASPTFTPSTLPSAGASAAVVEPTASAIASSPPTKVFNPVSVSAISVNDYWVLGYNTTSDGGIDSAMIMRTTDAGQHFTAIGSPDAYVAESPVRPAPTAVEISDIRFGDSNNGWAYGGGLFETADGGTSWTAVTQIPGDVIDLVAANNKVWAVVSLTAPSGSASPSATPQYAIYSSSYGKGEQTWSRVALPIALGSSQPSMVDQDGNVTVLADGPLRTGLMTHTLISVGGGGFTDHTGPCLQDEGGVLSNSKLGIWANCPTGHASALLVSTDRGATWTARTFPNGFPNPGEGIGAIDNVHAVVVNTGSNPAGLIRVSTTGPDVVAQGPGASVGTFVGFTDASRGFAILTAQASDLAQLWRTSDGGLTWTVVTL
jgi:hypothetical protein